MKRIMILILLTPVMLFAEEYKNNSVTLSVGPGFNTIDYHRLFLNNHIDLSAGGGFIDDDIQSSAIMPVRLTYIPFNFLIKPDIFVGGVFAYNWRDDTDRTDQRDPIFDKGTDACFEWGLGFTVSPIAEFVTIGAHVRFYSDNNDASKGFITIEAGYMF